MGLTILLADDNMTAQKLGKKILTEAGHNVVTVSNGLAAGKKIAELHPDIALLDVYMPGYTGVEICEKTKAAPETAQIPVLLIVGKMEPFRAEEGTKVKADGVIIKPFEARDLITIVEKLTGTGHNSEPAAPPRSVSDKAEAHPPAKTATAEFKPPQEIPKVRPTKSEWPPKLSAVKAIASAQPAPETPKTRGGSDRAAKGDTQPPSISRQQGGEVCDVCGHVNAENAVVCQQCDVPLPSSVLPYKNAASRRP